jgi:hypothetical protein
MIGFLAMLLSMAGLTTLPADRPIITSASTMASASVRRGSLLGRAKGARNSSISPRSAQSTPPTSVIVMCSRLTPSFTHICMQLMAAAPAPMHATLSESSGLFTSSAALRSAAVVMMAVPCWSS